MKVLEVLKWVDERLFFVEVGNNASKDIKGESAEGATGNPGAVSKRWYSWRNRSPKFVDNERGPAS